MTCRIKLGKDSRGWPLLLADDSPPAKRTAKRGSVKYPNRPQPRSVDLGTHRMPLYDESGRPIGPAESLHLLLSDGPISDSQFSKLASEFDNPNVIHNAAQRLGVIREKQTDGSVLVMLPPAPEPPDKPTTNLADDGQEESQVNLADDHSQADLTPLGEAQHQLGRTSVIGSGLQIIRGEGQARYVKTNELRNYLARARRGAKSRGAGELIGATLDDAIARRAKTNAVGRANEQRPSRARRYSRSDS